MGKKWVPSRKKQQQKNFWEKEKEANEKDGSVKNQKRRGRKRRKRKNNRKGTLEVELFPQKRKPAEK